MFSSIFIYAYFSNSILPIFRDHDRRMFALRKLLSENSKIHRNRRFLLNLQLSFIAWAAEFIGGVIGVLILFLPFANVSSRLKQIFTDLVYFVILPMIYMANGEDTKSSLLQNNLYLRFSDLVFNRWINKIVPDDAEDKHEKSEKDCASCGEETEPANQVHNCTPFKDFPQFNVFQ